MRELVKEWYCVHGTLDGVQKKYGFITDEQVESVRALLDGANKDIVKPNKTESEYDKLVKLYACYLNNSEKAGFTLEEEFNSTFKTVGEISYIRMIYPEYEVNEEISDVMLKCASPEFLGLEFVVDEEIEEPYIAGNNIYVTEKLTPARERALVRDSIKQGATFGKNLSPSRVKLICQAMSCFMEDSCDDLFIYLVNLTRQTGLSVKDFYESMSLKYIDRLELYDKYDCYFVLANENSIVVKSHRLSRPITVKSFEKLFLSLVKGNVEELEMIG